MKELKNDVDVEIKGVNYRFSNQIGKDSNLFTSFNQLSQSTFGISFENVGGQYEPHVLALEGRVCANVAVNQIPFYYRGERKFYIQLGTVMTAPEFRAQGLSRWLIENIIDRWQGCCDGIYLFANNSVLDFYPKFGFVKMPEYAYKRSGITPNNSKAVKLQMHAEESIRLVSEKYEQGNPFSAFYMTENQGLLSFYCQVIMKENVFYSPQYDVVIIAENNDGQIRCCDIFGETDAELSDVLGEISLGPEKEILLGFTPLNTSGFTAQMQREGDTTLFVHCSGDNLFAGEPLMFPVISHA
ncbi:GNAT family N-acetyltransferase [Desulfosporosinus sp. PR]|uniref:GNAT family N-acetyltransferase n=1 Tax=Candidatus Desulfosporosinus nitrosoreducens TaxID=3401928 RepID=UPI0027FE5FF8|nr:GNAT family N-acetyltransferase [Desulfosporosinus sp. PR]MDQ7094657.1 GNAT family N-acetyltransferase [Desulfosporosinus sp. PR]